MTRYGSAGGCRAADVAGRSLMWSAGGSGLAAPYGGGREPVAEPSAAVVQPGGDRPDGRAHDLGYFLVRVTLDVGEVDRELDFVRQVVQGAQDVGVGQPVQRLRFGRVARAAVARCGLRTRCSAAARGA